MWGWMSPCSGQGWCWTETPNSAPALSTLDLWQRPKCRAVRGHQGTPDQSHCRTASPTLLPVLVPAIPSQPLLPGGSRNVPWDITLSPGLHQGKTPARGDCNGLSLPPQPWKIVRIKS